MGFSSLEEIKVFTELYSSFSEEDNARYNANSDDPRLPRRCGRRDRPSTVFASRRPPAKSTKPITLVVTQKTNHFSKTKLDNLTGEAWGH